MNGFEYVIRQTERASQLHELRALDHAALAAMDDKALATWQTGFSSDSPQWRLGEHEWQRRQTVQQVKATQFAAYIGAASSVASAFVGVILGFYLGAQASKPAVAPEVKQGANASSQAITQNQALGTQDQNHTPVHRVQPAALPQQPDAKK